MMMRDTQATREYFDYALREVKEHIQSCHTLLSNGEGVPVNVYGSLYNEYKRLAQISYSMGEPVETLRPMIEEAMQSFLKLVSVEDPKEAKHEKLHVYIGIYEDLLEIMCLGILLHADEELLTAYKTAVDTHRGKDLLTENIWHAFKKTGPDPKAKIKLLYPKSYSQPQAVFEAHAQEEKLAAYIKGWNKTKRSATWFASHNTAEVNGAVTYTGYWNLESAAIAYLLKIDDSPFSHEKFFPKDLLDFARNKK